MKIVKYISILTLIFGAFSCNEEEINPRYGGGDDEDEDPVEIPPPPPPPPGPNTMVLDSLSI
ncbi:hypothetical protein QQ020_23020 [Fulvivirgaceae bacterium BMA12]|uniref:Lipoprotein n=1 Tax=Agaribacillus aureus TaxID=3051825 RepID=A0ABT8LF41_9BACT|nr:hypothetical protein [Fulvivirgaceae bacterium BMA12]